MNPIDIKDHRKIVSKFFEDFMVMLLFAYFLNANS